MAKRRLDKSSSQPRDKRSKNSYTRTILMSSCLAVAICIGFKGYLETRVNTRFNQIRMVEKTGLDVPERYWGSYRPGLYFGMKTREPYSVVTGLMWYFPRLLKSNGDGLRHWCEQSDNLKHYTWTEHDGRNFGIQEIEDGHFRLETSFVKRLGGDHGGDWTAKINVTTAETRFEEEQVSLIFYVALEEKAEGSLAYVKERKVKGDTPSLGRFQVSVLNESGEITSDSYLNTVTPGLHLLKETVLNSLRVVGKKDSRLLVLPGEQLQREDGSLASSNFIAIQITGRLPLKISVLFESGSFRNRPKRLMGSVFDEELKNHRENFNEKFESVFQLSAKGWKGKEITFAKAALSNMVGGIGYFYGSSRVSSSHTEGASVPYWKAPLYTAVPSRSFFPRGFLWDEAFHGLLLSHWDLEIELDIMNHWFDLMNIEGWIPREQILGVEALSKVPEEFVTQMNSNANPPVFFLTIEHILQNFKSDLKTDDQLLSKLERMMDRLEAWYDWFNTTQKGNLPTSYRWRGRSEEGNRELNPRTLTSGLDDYPRASHPTEDERHVDLRCWMSMAASTLSKLGLLFSRDVSRFVRDKDALRDSSLLNTLHWSEKTSSFADYGLHTDAVVLKRLPSVRTSDNNIQQKPPMVRVDLQEPHLRFVDTHFGYVSLFPFMLQILPSDSPQLEAILNKLKDPKLLWTDFGLRSLSVTSPLYGKYNTEHDPPYWRGSIWINMNYLTVRALKHYSDNGGPFTEKAKIMYSELRENIISNVIREYYRSGYIWEQYSDKTGEGKGCKPFTGWSALTVLLMAEIY